MLKNHHLGYKILIQNIKILFPVLLICILYSSCDIDHLYWELPKLSEVETFEPIEILDSSAICSGNVIDDGGSEITERGFCYGRNIDPTIDDNKILCGSGNGTFATDLNELTPNTLYFLRAFAKNNAGISYGNTVSFMTIKTFSDALENNSLAIIIDTQSSVDLNSARVLLDGFMSNGKVYWQSKLSDFNSRDYYTWEHPTPFPSDVIIISSINSSGVYRMVLKSESNPEHVLSVLTFQKWTKPHPSRIPNDNWYQLPNSFPANFYASAKEAILLNCPIFKILSHEYGYLQQNGGISVGQRNEMEFMQEAKDHFTLKSGFSKPVYYIFSMIYHEQADYGWYDLNIEERDRYFNSQFSMAPTETWNLSFSGKRKYTIAPSGATFCCLFGNAYCDNQNSAYIKLNGDTFVQQINAINTEVFSYGTLGVTLVELVTTANWSIVAPSLSCIVSADNINVTGWQEERDGAVNPLNSWDKNPKPIILRIDNLGTTLF